MAKVRLLLLLPLCLGIVLGCGRKSKTPAKVTGTVKYKGNLVKAGSVQFHVKDAGVYNAPIREDGTYMPTSLPDGDAVVTIETESANPDSKAPVYGGSRGGGKEAEPKSMKEMAKSSSGGESAAAKAMAAGAAKQPTEGTKKENFVKIPAKYNHPSSSGLKVTLAPGNNTNNFDLTD